MTAPRQLHPPWGAPRWTWHSVALAVAISACLFVALPLLEKLTGQMQGDASIRSIDGVVPPPPPPPPPPARPPEEQARPRPQPRLDAPKPRLDPMRLAFSLGRDFGGIGGDFFTDFAIMDHGGLASSDLVFEIAELDTPPRALAHVPPVYPPQARNRRVEGEVALEFIVGSDGMVGEVRVISSKPPMLFDDAAVQAVQRWRFQPGQRDGQPVSTRVRQSLFFRLE
ncbi:MAG TPA: energy transducer TonB [Kiritimatiellia bacterium]|nr:energy transducer TonB [Kiritimatiellia bacterium]HMO98384.1 energy transducer TonB [Kiritimatiellia bacterium]HMP96758.1 energy transducer TonB [Kiritimatiellia bacterium]